MPETSNTELVQAITELRDEVRVLRDALDEMRVLFEWAVRNDKLAGVPLERRKDASLTHSDASVGNSPASPVQASVECSDRQPGSSPLRRSSRQQGLW